MADKGLYYIAVMERYAGAYYDQHQIGGAAVELAQQPDSRWRQWAARLTAIAVLCPVALAAGCSSEEWSPPKVCPNLQAESLSPGANVVPPNPNLADSKHIVAQGMHELEEACGERLFEGAMQFFDIPVGAKELEAAIAWHPTALKQLQEADLNVTTILQPGKLPLRESMSTESIEAYCRAMKKAGVTSDMLGRVVLLPEIKQGSWVDVNVDYFGANFNKLAKVLQVHFPGVEVGSLIDTHPYELDDVLGSISRHKGNSDRELDLSKISFIGVQAYTNTAQVSFEGHKADIRGYFSAEIVQRVATAIDPGKPIDIVTGIASVDKVQGTEYSRNQRLAIALAFVDQIAESKNKGANIRSVVFFAQNKLEGGEGRDFSVSREDVEIVALLQHGLKDLGVEFSGFIVP